MFLEVFLACLLSQVVVVVGAWTVFQLRVRTLVRDPGALAMPSPEMVHLCPKHGRGCEGCEDTLAFFEAFAKAQGIDQMDPFERTELERLRRVVATQRERDKA